MEVFKRTKKKEVGSRKNSILIMFGWHSLGQGQKIKKEKVITIFYFYLVSVFLFFSFSDVSASTM